MHATKHKHNFFLKRKIDNLQEEQLVLVCLDWLGDKDPTCSSKLSSDDSSGFCDATVTQKSQII